MSKLASALAFALLLSTGALAQENGSAGTGQNWFERCTPDTINEIAAAVNDLSDSNARKASLSKQAKACMVRLSAAMKHIQ